MSRNTLSQKKHLEQKHLEQKHLEQKHLEQKLLKKDVRAKGKDVAIEWQIEGTKDRAVKVANEVVFLQTKADAAGSFQKSFANLAL